jgi:hypothetical protein
MAITQLSVFLENRPGQLAAAVRTISEAGVNIRALSLADTKDFGLLRLIVDDNAKAKAVLSERSIVLETPVIAARMDDEAGALDHILQLLETTQINIEYMYAFTGAAAGRAYVVLRVDDADAAETALRGGGVTLLTDAEMDEIV